MSISDISVVVLAAWELALFHLTLAVCVWRLIPGNAGISIAPERGGRWCKLNANARRRPELCPLGVGAFIALECERLSHPSRDGDKGTNSGSVSTLELGSTRQKD